MKKGELVQGYGNNEIGVVIGCENGFARVHWADGNWSWEECRYLQAVKKCP